MIFFLSYGALKIAPITETTGGTFAIKCPMISGSMLENQVAVIRKEMYGLPWAAES